MKEIKILGTGCPKCNKLEEITRKAADEMGLDYNIEKVKDINKIMDFGVVITPALVVNGEIKVSGKVPAIEEIKNLLQ